MRIRSARSSASIRSLATCAVAAVPKTQAHQPWRRRELSFALIRQVFDKVLVGYTVRDVSLQLGDTAADHRLGHPQLAGGSRKRAFVDDTHQN